MTTKTPDHHLLIIFLTGDEQLVIHYDFVFPCFFFAKTTISLALSIGCVYETMMQSEHNFLLLKN